MTQPVAHVNATRATNRRTMSLLRRMSAESLGAAGPLIDALRDRTVRASILELGGYDLERAGVVTSLE
jgi:hypothetical protein